MVDAWVSMPRANALVPNAFTLAFVECTSFPFLAIAARDVPVTFGGAELHLVGLSSLPARIAGKDSGGVFAAVVLLTLAFAMILRGENTGSFGSFPPHRVIVSDSGNTNPAPYLQGQPRRH